MLLVIGLELCELHFFPPESRSVYLRSVEINEQLSRMNSLNALCYRSNCVNSVVFNNWRLCVWEVDIAWIKIDVVDVLSLFLMSVCNITGRVLWKQLMLQNYSNSQTHSFRLMLYYQAKQIHDKRYYTIKVSNNSENVSDYRAKQ